MKMKNIDVRNPKKIEMTTSRPPPGLKYIKEFSEIVNEDSFGDQEMNVGPVKIMLTVDSGCFRELSRIKKCRHW